jgi:hypothetical protein
VEDKVRRLLAQITALEDELRGVLRQGETSVYFQIRGKRIEFERSVREAHGRLKTRLFRWLTTNRPQNLLTGPVIYSLGLPLLLLDIWVTLYQWTCFPIYGIAKVERGNYIVYDRQHLGYLNLFEKFHCRYCAYANGLIAYASEIAARTEQYFCPIKHARKMLGLHARHARFLDYGDATNYHARLEQYRQALKKDPPA